MQADWDKSKTGKSVITYGFLFGLLVLMVMMLAITPLPGWMDENIDEVRLGGPNTKLDAGELPRQHSGSCLKMATCGTLIVMRLGDIQSQPLFPMV